MLYLSWVVDSSNMLFIWRPWYIVSVVFHWFTWSLWEVDMGKTVILACTRQDDTGTREPNHPQGSPLFSQKINQEKKIPYRNSNFQIKKERKKQKSKIITTLTVHIESPPSLSSQITTPAKYRKNKINKRKQILY